MRCSAFYCPTGFSRGYNRLRTFRDLPGSCFLGVDQNQLNFLTIRTRNRFSSRSFNVHRPYRPKIDFGRRKAGLQHRSPGGPTATATRARSTNVQNLRVWDSVQFTVCLLSRKSRTRSWTTPLARANAVIHQDNTGLHGLLPLSLGDSIASSVV